MLEIRCYEAESEKASSRRDSNPGHVEDCEGWWSSGCRCSVGEHWQLEPDVSLVRLPVTAGPCHFCLIASYYLLLFHLYYDSNS